MQLIDIVLVPWNWLILHAVAIVIAIALLIAGTVFGKWAARAVRQWLPHAYGVDKNFAPLLAQVAQYGILGFAIVTALSFLGVPNTSILAVVGAAGLAVALALQNTLSNISAGIMLIWLRPIAIGDYITGNNVAGVVVEIGLFGTRLRSTSGLYIFTPNLNLWSNPITNHSREPRRRIDVNISIPETSNLAEARRTLLTIASSDSGVLADPAPTVHVDSFAGDKIVLQMRAWVPTPKYLDSLHHLTETAKLAINRQLAADHGGTAEVNVSADPHAINLEGSEPPHDATR